MMTLLSPGSINFVKLIPESTRLVVSIKNPLISIQGEIPKMPQEILSTAVLKGRYNALASQGRGLFESYNQVYEAYRELKGKYDALSARLATCEAENALLAESSRQDREKLGSLREIADPGQVSAFEADETLQRLRGEIARAEEEKENLLREIDRLSSEKRLLELETSRMATAKETDEDK